MNNTRQSYHIAVDAAFDVVEDIFGSYHHINIDQCYINIHTDWPADRIESRLKDIGVTYNKREVSNFYVFQIQWNHMFDLSIYSQEAKEEAVDPSEQVEPEGLPF